MSVRDSIYEVKGNQFRNLPTFAFRVERLSHLTVDKNGTFAHGMANTHILNEALVGVQLDQPINIPQDVNIPMHEATIFDVLVEKSRNEGGTGLRTVVQDSRIVANRAVIADIGAAKHNLKPSVRLVCGVYQGCVFIKSENHVGPPTKIGFVNECIVTKPAKNEPNFLTRPAPWHQSYVQAKIELGQYKTGVVTIFLNGQLDCVDSDGQPIEVKLNKYGLNSTALPAWKSSRWFLQSALVDTQFIAVSEYDAVLDQIVSVKKIHIDQLENGSYALNTVPSWNRHELFAHTKCFFAIVRKLMLHDLKDKIVVIEKASNDAHFRIVDVVDNRDRLFPTEFTSHFDDLA
ncbi:hypothetical protein L596_022709 [Steinernema carpocapsae]|uniref:Decapping nuclease n=1 Tax=Steinernema carpocapsae TaxID=34508 RepID=A0A4U5MMX5_STECR|nr:hypothetical protein L596_022709 [Steinernema carpocapsae]